MKVPTLHTSSCLISFCHLESSTISHHPHQNNIAMFCTTLRKRSEWASVPSTLLSQQQPKWQGIFPSPIHNKILTNPEQKLQTHDLAIPIPQDDKKALFQLILLSPTDLQDQQSYMSRIERLYHQTGGRDVGIVFLLQGIYPQEGGIRALMELQIRCASIFPQTLFCPLLTDGMA